MNTDIHFKSSNQLPEAAREIVKQATVAAKDAYQALSSEIEDGVERTKEYARHIVDATKETASHATVATQNASGVVEDMVKETYQTMLSELDKDVDRTKGYAKQAVDATKKTLATSKEYVRRHPVPVVLGAFAFGAAVGYMLLMALRKQTFGERYVDEPLGAVREAFLGALAPVAHGVHKGYDSARHGAEKAMDRVQSFAPGRNGGSLSHQIGRIGNNLKFW